MPSGSFHQTERRAGIGPGGALNRRRIRVAAEAPYPEAIGEHHRDVRRRSIVGLGDRPPSDHRNAKTLKIVTGDELRRDSLWRAIDSGHRSNRSDANDGGQLSRTLEIAIRLIGKDVRACAVWAWPHLDSRERRQVSGGARRRIPFDADQAAGSMNRQLAESHRLDDGEERGARGDSYRQRQCGDDRKPPLSAPAAAGLDGEKPFRGWSTVEVFLERTHTTREVPEP